MSRKWGFRSGAEDGIGLFSQSFDQRNALPCGHDKLIAYVLRIGHGADRNRHVAEALLANFRINFHTKIISTHLRRFRCL